MWPAAAPTRTAVAAQRWDPQCARPFAGTRFPPARCTVDGVGKEISHFLPAGAPSHAGQWAAEQEAAIYHKFNDGRKSMEAHGIPACKKGIAGRSPSESMARQ